MAYGELYRLEYRDQPLGRLTTCKILEEDYTGDWSYVKGSGDPVKISYEATEQDLFAQVVGSSCEIELISETNFEFIDLFDSDSRKYKIEIYKEPNTGETQVLWWAGYIIPDQYSEPLDFIENYVVRIFANDGIASIKNFNFLNKNSVDENGDYQKYIGVTSVFEILSKTLDNTDLAFGWDFGINIQENNADIDPSNPTLFGNIYLDYNVFYQSDTPTCDYVLKQILQSFGCQIKQFKGKWWITSILNLYGSHTREEYDSSMSYIQSYTYDVVKTYTGKYDETDDRLFFVRKQGQLSINPAYKEFSIHQTFGLKQSVILNNSFDIVEVTSPFEDSVVPGWNCPTGFYNKPAALLDAVEDRGYVLNLNYEHAAEGDPKNISSIYTYYPYLPANPNGYVLANLNNKTLKISFDAITWGGRGFYFNIILLVNPSTTYVLKIDNDVTGELEWKFPDGVGHDPYFPYPGVSRSDDIWVDGSSWSITTPLITTGIGFKIRFSTTKIDAYPTKVLGVDNVRVNICDENTNAFPIDFTWTTKINERNNYTPQVREIILGDAPNVDNRDDMYYCYFYKEDYTSSSVDNYKPTDSWTLTNEGADLYLMQVLSTMIARQFFKPKQAISGILKGNFNPVSSVEIGFMGDRVYMPNRFSCSYKYCEWQCEMLEIFGDRLLGDEPSGDNFIVTEDNNYILL